MTVLPLPAPTTELEAVNSILASIGERPVNTLEDSKRLDVVLAQRALIETSKLTQIRGWWFNSEEEITLTPDINGEIAVPTNVRKVDMHDKYYSDQYVFRGSKLYNKKTRAYDDFTDDVVVDWVVELPFDELPETARLYIMLRAGQVFQSRALGSQILFQFTDLDAGKAWALLLEEDAEAVDKSVETLDGVVDAVIVHGWRRSGLR